LGERFGPDYLPSAVREHRKEVMCGVHQVRPY
jgi:hypothetical protein